MTSQRCHHCEFIILFISSSVVIKSLSGFFCRSPFMNDLVTITPDGAVPFVSCTSSPEVTHINKYFVFVDFVCLFLVPLSIIVVCYSKVNTVEFSLFCIRFVELKPQWRIQDFHRGRQPSEQGAPDEI